MPLTFCSLCLLFFAHSWYRAKSSNSSVSVHQPQLHPYWHGSGIPPLFPLGSRSALLICLVHRLPPPPLIMVALASCGKQRAAPSSSSTAVSSNSTTHPKHEHPGSSASRHSSSSSKEALKDLNWRRRSGTNKCSEASCPLHPSGQGHAVLHGASGVAGRHTELPYEAKAGSRHCNPTNTTSSPARIEDDDGLVVVRARSKLSHDGSCNKAEGCSSFGISWQSRLFGDPSRSVLELAPGSDAEPPYRHCMLRKAVSLRSEQNCDAPWLSTAFSLQSKNGQTAQLEAALGSVSITPPRTSRSCTTPQSDHYSLGTSLAWPSSAACSSFTDRSWVRLGSGSNESALNATDTTDSSRCDRSHPSDDSAHYKQYKLGQKDIAFRKLLEKLNHKVALPSKKGSRTSRDSGYGSFRSAEGPCAHTEWRRPTQGTGRRVNTASDFGFGCWKPERSSKGGNGSSDFALYHEGHDFCDKYNTLNPKAREFLSFQCGSQEAAVDRQPESSRCQASTISEPIYAHERHFQPLGHEFGPYLPLVGYATLPTVSQKMSIITSESAQAAIDTNLWAVQRGLIPINPQAGFACSPMSRVDSGGTAMHTSVPPSSDGRVASRLQNMDFRSREPAVIAPGPLKTAPIVVPVPKPVSHPVYPFSSPGNIEAVPVPKPRAPDTEGQQAYENWIEWRKANEPGYAMACKMRQQRRSQLGNPRKQKQASAPKTNTKSSNEQKT